MTQRPTSSTVRILSGMFLVNLSTALIFAVFSLLVENMAEALQIPVAQAGLLFGIAGLGAGPGWFLAAMMAKWLSRRTMLLLFLAVEMVMILVLSVSVHWLPALVALFLMGMAQCAALSAALSVVADVDPPRAVSHLNLVMSANLVFPAMAWLVGFLLQGGMTWRTALGWLLTPLGVALVWVAGLRLPSFAPGTEDGRTNWKQALEFPVRKPLLTAFVAAGFSLAIVPMAWVAVFAGNVLGSAHQATKATAVCLFGIGFGQLVAAAWARRRPIRHPLGWLAIALAIVYASLWIGQARWQGWLIIGAMGLLGGLMQPTTLAMARQYVGLSSPQAIGVLGAWGEISAAVVVYLIGFTASLVTLPKAIGLLSICAVGIALAGFSSRPIVRKTEA